MSVSPAVQDRLRRTCQGSLQCVHDILASNDTGLGLQSLESQELYHKLAMVFGESTRGSRICIFIVDVGTSSSSHILCALGKSCPLDKDLGSVYPPQLQSLILKYLPSWASLGG